MNLEKINNCAFFPNHPGARIPGGWHLNDATKLFRGIYAASTTELLPLRIRTASQTAQRALLAQIVQRTHERPVADALAHPGEFADGESMRQVRDRVRWAWCTSGKIFDRFKSSYDALFAEGPDDQAVVNAIMAAL